MIIKIAHKQDKQVLFNIQYISIEYSRRKQKNGRIPHPLTNFDHQKH